jgi:hypothetical protein
MQRFLKLLRKTKYKMLTFNPRLHDPSRLARVKFRGRVMHVIRSSTSWILKRVETSIIILAWNVWAHISGTWLAQANLHRVNAALTDLYLHVLVFLKSPLNKSCPSFDDLSAYKISCPNVDWFKFCIYLRSLNVRYSHSVQFRTT